MQRLSIYPRELYAIIEEISKWRQYLSGSKIIIRTNQKSIRELMQKNNSNARATIIFSQIIGL